MLIQLKDRQITSLTDNALETMERDFLFYNKTLISLNLSNLKIIGNYLLPLNRVILELNIPKVKTIGRYFLSFHPKLDSLHSNIATPTKLNLCKNPNLKKQ